MSETVAVIVPIGDSPANAIGCLKSLARHTSHYRCIVVGNDNTSRLDEFRKIIPAERFHFEQIGPNGGVIAAWNRGLELARESGNAYAVVASPDTAFTPGWLFRTMAALEKLDLIGPMSNASGGQPHQKINIPGRGRLDASEDAWIELSSRLKRNYSGRTAVGSIGDFWMAAKTRVWWENAFDKTHVFSPNEAAGAMEFQKRFRGKIGVAQDVFIFQHREMVPDNSAVNPAQSAAQTQFNNSYISRRSDLAAQVPASARRVLDVGCSVGALGATLKQRGATYVAGVEYDPAMADVAKARLDQVVCGDAETVPLDELVEHGLFDCLIFGDVLEHLRDPWNVLARYCTVLRPGGYVVASLPNVRHFTTICNLLFKGHWPYRTRGIHDRTHLRWFTRRNIEELFEFANLEIEHWERIYRIIETPDPRNRFARWFAIPPLRELFAFQYFVRARKPDSK